MESDTRYVWVGAAMLALAAVLAVGLYWLGGGGGGHASQRYVVYFKNQSLEGLQINSDVRMQGIKVGKVLDYVIQPNQAKTVRVVLELDARAPVLEGAEAVVSRNLVTGLAAIDIDNVWKGGTPLTYVPEGEEYPLIDEGVPDMARFQRNLEGIGSATQEALGRVNTLLSDDNQRALAVSLDNLAALSGELRADARALTPRLAATLDATRAAAERVDALSGELAPLAREGGQVLARTGARLDALADDAGATLRETRATLKTIDQGFEAMRMDLRLSVDLGTQEVQSAARALRVASDTLQASGREFADPGRLLHGPHKAELGPGE